MIKLSSKIKNISVIRGSGILGDPLLLFEEGARIPSSNSDGTKRGCKYMQNIGDGYGGVDLLPSPLPSLAYLRDLIKRDSHRICTTCHSCIYLIVF